MRDSAERGDEVTFGDLASMVWRRRWLVAALCFAAAFGTYAMSKVMPKWYESSATLVTPKEGSGGLLSNLMVSGMLQQNSGVGVGMPTLPSFTPNRDLLIGVLKSRTIAQAIVERFELQARYRVSYVDDAIKLLRDLTTIATSREVAIVVRSRRRLIASSR